MMDVHAVAYSFSHKKNRCITVIRAVADIPITERCYKKIIGTLLVTLM
jgi:hypothetical protein